jgi:hypothetical protein
MLKPIFNEGYNNIFLKVDFSSITFKAYIDKRLNQKVATKNRSPTHDGDSLAR